MPWVKLENSTDVVLISEEDVDYVKQFRWFQNGGRQNYIVRRIREEKKQNILFLHIEILNRMGYFDFEKGDHKNQDVLDNRRENLRPSINSQNQFNGGLRMNNTTGYRGVSYCNCTGKYRAEIQVNKQRIRLGRFNTPEKLMKRTRKQHESIMENFVQSISWINNLMELTCHVSVAFHEKL